MAVRASALLAALVLLGPAGRASAGLLAETYYPLAPGNFWEYLVNGSATSTDTVLPSTQNIGGVDTVVVQSTDGSSSNLTNDSSGLRLHRISDPPDTATFAPPALLLAADFAVGVPMISSGDLTLSGVGTLGYMTTATASGPVAITVPFGSFDAILLEATLSVDGESLTDRVWLVANVGPVRWVEDVFGDPVTRELTSTNVPEPASIHLLALGAAILCLQRRRRSGTAVRSAADARPAPARPS